MIAAAIAVIARPAMQQSARQKFYIQHIDCIFLTRSFFFYYRRYHHHTHIRPQSTITVTKHDFMNNLYILFFFCVYFLITKGGITWFCTGVFVFCFAYSFGYFWKGGMKVKRKWNGFMEWGI